MLTVQEALDAILNAVDEVPTCRIAINDALGHVLAEDIVSDVDSPPFDKSLMDGYAIRAADIADEAANGLTVIEEIAAGPAPGDAARREAMGRGDGPEGRAGAGDESVK